MRLESITLSQFRNHDFLEFEPGRFITNIYGLNGSGKTSILESIHYCALTKGFTGNSDHDCLMFGKNEFTLRSDFSNDTGKHSSIVVAFRVPKDKRILVNDQEPNTFSEHIGTIPCVTFTPKELVIITGSPSERRRFIDSAICQHDKKYLYDLLQYKKILQQRNALLSIYHGSLSDQYSLDVLTDQIVNYAVEIVITREQFTRRFSNIFNIVCKWLPENRKPEILYLSNLEKGVKINNKEEKKKFFKRRYEDAFKLEIARKQTITGPHRDDLLLLLDQKEVKKYSSQGQQRAFLVAMKMSMHEYLQEYSGETPITLLDDLFSELDEKVTEQMIQSISTKSQIIITSTKKREGQGITNFHLDATHQ